MHDQGIGSLGVSAAGHTVLAILSMAVIFLALLVEGGWAQRVFRQSWLVKLGTVSYGIYLLHQPVVGALHAIVLDQSPKIADLTDAAITLLALGCTLIAASVSWRFFERPIIARGQRVSYQGTDAGPRESMSGLPRPVARGER
jgi:peptidoglycan/LPS O-acetylase OafA/YrhL